MIRFVLALSVLLSCVSCGTAAEPKADAATPALGWTVELTRDATFILRYDGATILRAKYAAWGPNWKFAQFNTAIGTNENDTWAITGDIADLNLGINGEIKSTKDKLVFQWKLKASKASLNNTGGGLIFTVRRDSQVFGSDVPAPIIDGTNWSWTPKTGQTVKVQFDGTDRASYFEPGGTQEIRSFFIPKDVNVGESTVTMTITLPPNTERRDGASKRYSEYDPATWLSKTIDYNGSPVDLSYLNEKPAGARGFVKAEGDRFVFADGTPVRFWGANIAAYALFNAENKAIEQQARRLAALGFNLVRIHHHDSADWSPNVFVESSKDTKELNDKNLDRIDYWVKCLRDQGIYVWVDLHVGRPFREGDGIDGFEEMLKGPSGRKAVGSNYVNPSITAGMKEFATAYLTRTNKYTGMRFVDDPTVMGVLITNENDLTQHFGNEFLPDKNHPKHMAWFNAMKKRIATERGLDNTKSGQTWLAGPSKVVLNQIEYDWNQDFIKHLRSIGVKVPIATTSMWGNNPLFSLPALTAGDVIDSHSYGQAESLSSNPKYDDHSAHWIAAAQVENMPLTVTEWNTEYPQRDRFTQPLFIAATAAFQGWDAPMIYAYQQAPLVPQSKIDKFGIVNDPAMVALMPAAALIYRTQQVKPAEKTVVFAPGEDLLMKNISPENTPALRTISERHRLVIGLPKTPLLPWLKGDDKTNTNDPEPLGEGSITSDTGELTRDWLNGTYTINSPQAQAIMGWIGGREIALTDVAFDIKTPKATVAVTALDGQPIATSKRMLISVAAQTHFTQSNSLVQAEPVIGTLRFKNAVVIEPLSPTGKPLAKVPQTTTVDLTGEFATQWFLLTRP